MKTRKLGLPLGPRAQIVPKWHLRNRRCDPAKAGQLARHESLPGAVMERTDIAATVTAACGRDWAEQFVSPAVEALPEPASWAALDKNGTRSSRRSRETIPPGLFNREFMLSEAGAWEVVE